MFFVSWRGQKLGVKIEEKQERRKFPERDEDIITQLFWNKINSPLLFWSIGSITRNLELFSEFTITRAWQEVQHVMYNWKIGSQGRLGDERWENPCFALLIFSSFLGWIVVRRYITTVATQTVVIAFPVPRERETDYWFSFILNIPKGLLINVDSEGMEM